MSDLGLLLVDNSWAWTSLAAMAFAAIVFFTSAAGSDWAPILVMATVPVQREMLLGRNEAQVTLTQAALGAFFAGALIPLAHGRLRLKVDAVAICMGLVVSILALSVIVASDLGTWAAESYRWLVAALFFVVARAYFSPRSSLRLLSALCVGIGLAAGLALMQVIVNDAPASFARDGRIRVYGWFGEPNPFAAFIWIVTLPVLAYAMLSSDRRAVRISCGLAGAVGLAALVLTQSRGGILGLGAGLAVLAGAVLLRQRRRILLIAGTVTAVALAVAIVTVIRAESWATSRVATTPGNWADQERAAHWSAAFGMVRAHPVDGVGAGGFSEYFRTYTEYWRFRVSRGHAHNAYLQLAAEAGLPGLLAYGLMMASIIAALVRSARTAASSWLPSGAVAVSVALLTHQMVDVLHVLSLGLLFAGLWAASLASGQKGNLSREHNFAA